MHWRGSRRLLLSAAQIGGVCLPAAIALTAALPFSLAAVFAYAGAALGYFAFWGATGAVEPVAAGFLILAASCLFHDVIPASRRWFFPLLSSGIYALTALIFLLSAPVHTKAVCVFAGKAALVCLCTYLFTGLSEKRAESVAALGFGLLLSGSRAPAPAGIAAQRDFIRLRGVFVQRDAGILAGLGRVRSRLGFELPAGLQRGRDAVSGLAHMPLLKTPLRHFARVRLFSRAGPFVVPLWRGADDVPARRFSRNGSGPHFVEACPAASCRARCAARRSAGKGAHGSIRRFMVACNGFAARVYQWVGATECRSF